jgi:hypothetical protein
MLPEYEYENWFERSELSERKITEAITPLLPEFETLREALEGHSKMVLALEGENCAETKVTRRLVGCRFGNCYLAMCPPCVRELRISFILAALSCTDELRSVVKQGFPMTAFSADLNIGTYPVGQLDQMDLPLLKSRIQREHRRAGFPLAFAGINISLNDESPSKNPPFWQARVDGVVVGLEVDAVKAALGRLYPRAASTSRPLERSELSQALNDVIKPTFARRVTRIGGMGRQTTDNYDLDASQLRELALALGEFELTERYALTGCRRHNHNRYVNYRGGWLYPDLGILRRIKWAERVRTANPN